MSRSRSIPHRPSAPPASSARPSRVWHGDPQALLLAVQFIDMRSQDFLAKGGRVLEPRDPSDAPRDPATAGDGAAVTPAADDAQTADSPPMTPRSAADSGPIMLQLIAELQARIASK